MTMIDTAYTPAEAKERNEGHPIAATGNLPKYPYGTSLCLDTATLKKMGMTTPPPVGTKWLLQAMVEVTGARQEKEQDGDTRISTDLQITAMEMAPAAATAEQRAAVLYDKPA